MPLSSQVRHQHLSGRMVYDKQFPLAKCNGVITRTQYHRADMCMLINGIRKKIGSV